MRRTARIESDSVWAPLSDAMSLAACAFLLVLVVMFVAYQQSEQKRKRELEARVDAQTKIEKARLDAQQALAELTATDGVVATGNGGVKLPEWMLFRSAEADVTTTGREWISRELVPTLRKILTDPDQCVLIAGHTDSVPIRSNAFPSNWELSTRRATNVLRAVLEELPGVRPGAIYAAGFADTQLLAGVAGDDGANRRVELYVDRCFGAASATPSVSR
jgi:chemotaxis protein MotB